MWESPLQLIAVIVAVLLVSKFFPSYGSKKRDAPQKHEARGETKNPDGKQNKMSLMERLYTVAIIIFLLVMFATIPFWARLQREVSDTAFDWFISLFGF